MFNSFLMFLNYSLVLVYGIFISTSLADVEINKKNICSIIALFLIISNIQVILFVVFNYRLVEMLYPLITHLPVVLFLIFYFKKPLHISISSVLTAYLMATPRRLIGTCFSALFGGSQAAFNISQIIITVPLLFLIIRFLGKPIKKLISLKKLSLLLFSGFLLLYYVFSYATTVYSDLLYSGNLIAVDFLCTICVLSYILFTIFYYQETLKRFSTEQNNKLLRIKSQQAEISLNSMRESQKLTAQYRHDMRHHMRFIKTCLGNNRVDDAIKYIDKLCKSFNSVKVETFCENVDANLIISYYVSLARAAKISINIETAIPKDILLSSLEISIILSNLLENAIKACTQVEKIADRKLAMFSTVKNGKLYLSVSNSYIGNVTITGGKPQTDVPGHGIGVNSIASIIEKHGGNFLYEASDGVFTFKMVI